MAKVQDGTVEVRADSGDVRVRYENGSAHVTFVGTDGTGDESEVCVQLDDFRELLPYLEDFTLKRGLVPGYFAGDFEDPHETGDDEDEEDCDNSAPPF